MRRGPAGRLIRGSALRPNEKLVMLALLDRADNEDCKIPAWRSPSLTAVGQDTSLARSTVVVTLAHLELHGWLERSGRKAGQMAGSKQSGRGRSGTRWALFPLDFAPGPCSCRKPDSPARGPSKRQKVRTEDHPDSPSDHLAAAGQAVNRAKGVREEGEGRWMGQPGGFFDAEANGY